MNEYMVTAFALSGVHVTGGWEGAFEGESAGALGPVVEKRHKLFTKMSTNTSVQNYFFEFLLYDMVRSCC